MSVVITNLQHAQKINLRLLKQIANAVLAVLEIESAEIGVCLIEATEMTRLNETFLQHAGSTDVIAFDYSDAGTRSPDARAKVHGEIFVCLDAAVLQAPKFGSNWQSELVRYLIHGTLHLTGHDDRTTAARRKMKQQENRLLGMVARRFSLAQLSRPARISK
jgi:probable rRNA maturation factor